MVMRELPASVQKNAVFRRAVDALSASRRNDYVRFFRLATTAPYLTSCLLFRMFSFVRSQALLQMRRAYRGREGFSIEEFTKMLCFIDEDEAIDFVAHSGLRVVDNNAGEKEIDFMSSSPVSDEVGGENSPTARRVSNTISETYPSSPPPISHSALSGPQKWQPRRMDSFIESKAEGYKISDIVRGSLSKAGAAKTAVERIVKKASAKSGMRTATSHTHNISAATIPKLPSFEPPAVPPSQGFVVGQVKRQRQPNHHPLVCHLTRQRANRLVFDSSRHLRRPDVRTPS